MIACIKQAAFFHSVGSIKNQLLVYIVPEGIRKDLCKLVLKNDINEESFECTLNAPHEYQEKILKEKDNYIGVYYAIVEFRERSGVKQVPFHAKAIAIKHK